MDVLNPNYSISAKLKENLSVSSFITSLDLLVIDTLVLSLKTTLKERSFNSIPGSSYSNKR